jgi:hypothetical protein
MTGGKSIAEGFCTRFGVNPYIYRAPGRVNLIGEHRDYDDALVMPAAIGFYCWVAASPRKDQKLVVFFRGVPGIRPKWDGLLTPCYRGLLSEAAYKRAHHVVTVIE